MSFDVQEPINRPNGLGYSELSRAWNNTSHSATIFIFTPRVMSRQFVRPFVYNFNGNLVDEVIGRQFSADIFKGNHKSDAVLGAIMPTAGNGIYEVRNQEMSTYFTFLLVIQSTRNVPSMDPFLRAPSPFKRQIISGYFTTPPYSYTLGYGKPTIDLNACLVFTHDSVFNDTPLDMTTTFNGNQEMNGMIASGLNLNVDNISQAAEQVVVPNFYSGNTDNRLYLMRPMDLDKAANLTFNGYDSGVDGINNAALASVAGERGGAAAVPVASALKSPMAQLKSICEGSRMCVMSNLFDSTQQNSFTNPFIPNTENPAEYQRHMRDMFTEQLRSVDIGTLAREGVDLDTTMMMSMADLDRMFPNLVVMPYVIEKYAQCELTPQDEIVTQKSVMSSLMADAINSILPAFNIGEIGFSYYSHLSGDGGMTRGVWDIQKAVALLPHQRDAQGVDRKLMADTMMFKNELERNFFPILKASGGDFEIHVDANCYNISLVNLIFQDEKSICSNPNGYWETNNCFSNFANPLIAGKEIAQKNVAALTTLRDATLASLTPSNVILPF